MRRPTFDVIVPDVNLLVYAYNNGAPQYSAAREWWEALMRGEEPIGIPWSVVTGFIRLMSSASVVTSPFSPSDAAGYAMEWFRYPHVTLLDPGDRHWEFFQQNLSVSGSGPKLVMDAHIAALAMEHEAEVHSNDADFDRFPGLRRHNPIPSE